MIRLAWFRQYNLHGAAKPLALMAGIAMCVSLAGCGDNQTQSANQVAAKQEMKSAGQDLKAAAVETGAALDNAAKDAKPVADRLAVKAKEGLANLSDATGDAASKAGHALDTAGQKTDTAAHRAADHARESADNQQQ